MGLINETKRESCRLGCSSINLGAPETAVLIAIYSMNIHQYDHCHFLDTQVPSGLAIGKSYPHLSSHGGKISETHGLQKSSDLL